jgi:hypothetical protein
VGADENRVLLEAKGLSDEIVDKVIARLGVTCSSLTIVVVHDGATLNMQVSPKEAAMVNGDRYTDRSTGATGAKSFGQGSEAKNLGAVTHLVQPGDFETLRLFLANHGVSDSDLKELKEAIQSDPKPTESGGFGTNVGSWIGRMTTKAMCGTWKIAVQTVGEVLTKGLLTYYGLSAHD